MALELDKIREISERVAGSMGVEIVEVEFIGGAGRKGRTLRIYIDRVTDTLPGRANGPREKVAGANTSDTQMHATSEKSKPKRQPWRDPRGANLRGGHQSGELLGNQIGDQSSGNQAGEGAAQSLAETSVPTASPVALEIDGSAAIQESHSQGGVSLEDCANLAREVSTILDVEDVVPGAEYVLEVSSPGLDRKLLKAADYERFTGSLVKLQTRTPMGVSETSKGNRFFEGRLESFDGAKLVLDTAQGKRSRKKRGAEPAGKVEIELKNVEKANLVPEL